MNHLRNIFSNDTPPPGQNFPCVVFDANPVGALILYSYENKHRKKPNDYEANGVSKGNVFCKVPQQWQDSKILLEQVSLDGCKGSWILCLKK